MRGMGRVFKRGSVYWIAYCYRGKEHRESAESDRENDANKLLKKRLGEIARGRLVGPTEDRVTFEDLATDYLRDRELRGRRATRWAKACVSHLREHFGSKHALDVTAPQIRAYAEARLAEGAAPGTVNRDLAVLGRMFTLAIQAGRLSNKPHIPKLREPQPRQGFFEHAEYLAVRAQLPATYQDVLDFGYHSGWRRGEIIGLEWRDVDREAGVIRLRPEQSKNAEGRVLALSGPLAATIEGRWGVRALGCPYVFQVDGKCLGDWRKGWASACIAAGFFVVDEKTEGKKPTKLFHDLRRTVARNLLRSGTPERVAMTVTGHKTRSVFDRYAIVREDDIREATARLAEYVARQSSTPTVVPISRAMEGRRA